MSKKQEGTKRRSRFLPWAMFGLILGAGLAFTLVRWQKRAMPWTALDRDAHDLSIYEVSGDTTRDWPVDGETGDTGLEF